eukprot:g19369.t1
MRRNQPKAPPGMYRNQQNQRAIAARGPGPDVENRSARGPNQADVAPEGYRGQERPARYFSNPLLNSWSTWMEKDMKATIDGQATEIAYLSNLLANSEQKTLAREAERDRALATVREKEEEIEDGKQLNRERSERIRELEGTRRNLERQLQLYHERDSQQIQQRIEQRYPPQQLPPPNDDTLRATPPPPHAPME